MRSLHACFTYRRQASATEPLQPHGDAEQGGGSEDGRDAEVAGVAPPTSGATHHKHPFSRARLRWSTAVFTFIASLLFADQNLLSPNLSVAAEFFGFDDTQKDVYLGGYVNVAFFAVGAPAALLVGWLADTYNRRNMLFIVAVIGQVPCLCTLWVTQYWQFLFTRMLTGISVGGVFPLLYSLLSDMFPVTQRAFVSSFITIATGIGVFVGQMIAAWVGPAVNDWRMPFTVIAAPSLLCSILMLFIVKEPPRGVCEEALQDVAGQVVYSERITWPKMKQLMRVPTNWLIVLQGIPGSTLWGAFFVYFNDYLQIKNDWSTGLTTAVISVFGVGAAVGVVGGGWVGQQLYNRKKEWSPVFSGVCVLLAIAPLEVLVNVNMADNVGLAFAVSFLAGLFAAVAGPNIKAIMLNVNDPAVRGVALALQSMTDDIGKALGPFIVAAFISGLGRYVSFNIALMGSVPAGIMIACVCFYITKDEERVQQRLEVWKRSREDAHVTPLEALQLQGDSSGSLCGLEADCHLASKAGGAGGAPKGVDGQDCQLGGRGGGSGLTGTASTPSDVCSPGSSSISGVEKKLTGAGTGSSLSIEADCHSGQREGGATPTTPSSACDAKGPRGEGQDDTSNPLFDMAAPGIEALGGAGTPPPGAQARSGDAERK